MRYAAVRFSCAAHLLTGMRAQPDHSSSLVSSMALCAVSLAACTWLSSQRPVLELSSSSQKTMCPCATRSHVVPLPQLLHVEELFAPVEAEKEPASQLVHALCAVPL